MSSYIAFQRRRKYIQNDHHHTAVFVYVCIPACVSVFVWQQRTHQGSNVFQRMIISSTDIACCIILILTTPKFFLELCYFSASRFSLPSNFWRVAWQFVIWPAFCYFVIDPLIPQTLGGGGGNTYCTTGNASDGFLGVFLFGCVNICCFFWEHMNIVKIRSVAEHLWYDIVKCRRVRYALHTVQS